MQVSATKLQQNILDAMKAGNDLTAMGRSFGIYMGETRAMYAGGPQVPVKTKIARKTVKAMVEKGLISAVTRQIANGNRYPAFDLVCVPTAV